MKHLALTAILILSLVAVSFGDMTFPPEGWKEIPDPIASPYAEDSDELSIFGGQYPKSFNYYLETSSSTSTLFSSMFETLLTLNSMTLEYEPHLAEKWIISNDKKTFTFFINKKAKWSDGKPVTAHDVLWTFNAILNPVNLTGPHKVSLERFQAPEIIDDYTIRFTAKDVHWQNLGAVGGFHIMPKHVYAKHDFNKINFEFPVISGHYKLGEIKEGIYLKLERRNDWWNSTSPAAAGTANFQTLKIRYFADRNNAFESFNKGLFDLFPVYTSRIWVKQTNGPDYTSNRIIKQKIYNHQPVGFQGFAMNMRQFPFDDIRVRKAMAHLLDRKKMNHTIMYDQYFLHRSYYEDLYSKEIPCSNPVYDFDKKKARKLLTEAGWKANPKTGFLEKNGKKFSFKFLTRDPSTDKFLAIYAEDLKDVGIELVTDKKDWAAWMKDMDGFNYQMTWAAWGAGLFKDPEGMWASKEADRKGSNNITGFKNKQVDTLIEQQKSIFDINKRNDIARSVDKILCENVPYVLLWNINYTRLLYWNKFGTPPTVLSKYGREDSAYYYWWIDPDAEEDLNDSAKAITALPSKEPSVKFDTSFKP